MTKIDKNTIVCDMWVCVVLAVLAFFLTFPCNVLAQTTSSGEIDDLINIQPPKDVNIGYSLIAPHSPLYFLKTLREQAEITLSTTSQAKVIRQLEFAQRRLREVNSLVKAEKQDLIAPILERYNLHLSQAASFAKEDEQLQFKVGEVASWHLNVLQRVYGSVGNEKAKVAIRAAIISAEDRINQITENLKLENKQKLNRMVAAERAMACKFLIREAGGNDLTSSEREILKEKVKQCRQAVKDQLKDELQEIKKRQTTPSPTTR